jgi:hypothetical protein
LGIVLDLGSNFLFFLSFFLALTNITDITLQLDTHHTHTMHALAGYGSSDDEDESIQQQQLPPPVSMGSTSSLSTTQSTASSSQAPLPNPPPKRKQVDRTADGRVAFTIQVDSKAESYNSDEDDDTSARKASQALTNSNKRSSLAALLPPPKRARTDSRPAATAPRTDSSTAAAATATTTITTASPTTGIACPVTKVSSTSTSAIADDYQASKKPMGVSLASRLTTLHTTTATSAATASQTQPPESTTTATATAIDDLPSAYHADDATSGAQQSYQSQYAMPSATPNYATYNSVAMIEHGLTPWGEPLPSKEVSCSHFAELLDCFRLTGG